MPSIFLVCFVFLYLLQADGRLWVMNYLLFVTELKVNIALHRYELSRLFGHCFIIFAIFLFFFRQCDPLHIFIHCLCCILQKWPNLQHLISSSQNSFFTECRVYICHYQHICGVIFITAYSLQNKVINWGEMVNCYWLFLLVAEMLVMLLATIYQFICWNLSEWVVQIWKMGHFLDAL